MDDTTRRRAELYVRSLAPCETRNELNAIVERLRDMERRNVLEAVDLTVWGDAVCLAGASAQVGTGKRIADRIREFHSWAEDRQVSLDPFFNWSNVESSMSKESFRRVVPPQRCLAIYDDEGRLEDIYPSRVEGTVRSLQDGLRSLERDDARRVEHSLVFGEVS